MATSRKNGLRISGRASDRWTAFGFPGRRPVRPIHIGLEEEIEAALSEAVKTATAEVGTCY
jgi:hypothetical protein